MSGVTEPTATVAAEPVGFMVMDAVFPHYLDFAAGLAVQHSPWFFPTVYATADLAHESAERIRERREIETVVVALHPVSGAA